MDRVTLHDEMVDILSEAGSGGLAFEAVADLVNFRQVYSKRDGSPVRGFQIRLRALKYDRLFEVSGGMVRLRSLSD